MQNIASYDVLELLAENLEPWRLSCTVHNSKLLLAQSVLKCGKGCSEPGLWHYNKLTLGYALWPAAVCVILPYFLLLLLA